MSNSAEYYYKYLNTTGKVVKVRKERSLEDDLVYPPSLKKMTRIAKKTVNESKSRELDANNSLLIGKELNRQEGHIFQPYKPNSSVIPHRDQLDKIPTSVYIPKGFKLDNSPIPGAGLGIFATKDFPAEYDIGAYKGKFLTPEEYNQINRTLLYVWEVNDYEENPDRAISEKLDPNKAIGYIDGENKKTSNFLRYVNHPINKETENLRSAQIGREIHYITTRPIKAGEELTVNYGPAYSMMLLGKVI